MKLLAVALLSCTLVAPPVFAAGAGHATLEDVSFTLTDLLPDDGEESYWKSVDTGDLPNTNFSTIVRGPQERATVHGAFSEGSVHLAVGGHSGSASLAGGVIDAQIAWDRIVAGERITGSVVYGTMLLELAPHSSLTVSGLASIFGHSNESAEAFSIRAGISFGLPTGPVFDYLRHEGSDPFAVDAQRRVSVTWVNDSAFVQSTLFDFNVGAFLYPERVAVPEPSAGALLLAGLAAVALRRRRR